MENLFIIKGEEDYLQGLEAFNSQEPWHLRKAFRHFCRAAEQGHIEAMFRVGYLYLFGSPEILRNTLKAFECFKQSADSGIDVAKYYLAVCYINGIGVEKNTQLAVELFKEALKLGYSESADILSDIYRYGVGVPCDINKALEYNSYARQAKLLNVNAEIKYWNLIINRRTS